MAKRRLLLIREPIGDCVPEQVAEEIASIATVLGVKVDDLADVAYIVIETEATDYAVLGIARRWRIWRQSSLTL